MIWVATGFDIALSGSAIPGRYTVTTRLGNATVLGQVSFQVEDFVPQRIRAPSDPPTRPGLKPVRQLSFKLKANFLYGPPATGLKSETRITLRRNSRPYPTYKSFQFGLIEDDFYRKSLSPIKNRTNEQGQAIIAIDLNTIPDTSQPLLAYLQTAVFDVSGRPVNAQIALPLRPREVEVGLKKSFTGALNAGDKAEFEFIALTKNGTPVADRTLAYELVKEDYYYSWFRSGND